jgi:hypothetical protein
MCGVFSQRLLNITGVLLNKCLKEGGYQNGNSLFYRWWFGFYIWHCVVLGFSRLPLAQANTAFTGLVPDGAKRITRK